MEKNRNRIGWIDDLRGFAILAMIAHHAVYDMITLLPNPPYFLERILTSSAFEFVRLGFVAIFLLLAGICTRLTQGPYVRALKVAVGAMLVTAATWLVMPDSLVVFGILHCMAACMLIYAVAGRLFEKVPPLAGFIVCIVLAILMHHIEDGYIGFGSMALHLPQSLYRGGVWLALGFPAKDFVSVDYVPLFPNLFLFLAGSYLGRMRLPRMGSHSRGLAYVGRHSLFIYLLHQPVLWGIFYAIGRL
ncbi:MAG: heparan-alpha-glucosaminide N-acetyltransferase [Clostridia bacterium]|nr:heparan-alpha-glucosaminide N-acetyltransferase [Clostridia bacterium]